MTDEQYDKIVKELHSIGCVLYFIAGVVLSITLRM